jgi:hypothetical protein
MSHIASTECIHKKLKGDPLAGSPFLIISMLRQEPVGQSQHRRLHGN